MDIDHRDWLAASAMSALLSNVDMEKVTDLVEMADDVSILSYIVADAMLREKNRGKSIRGRDSKGPQGSGRTQGKDPAERGSD